MRMYGDRSSLLLFTKTSICSTYAVIWCYRYFFITLFLGAASAGLHYELSELVVQFLFPLCVTACICFGILCSKRSFSETVAIVLCVIWSALWLFIVLNENIYVMVTFPIWLMLFGLAMIFYWFCYIPYFKEV